MITLVFIGNAGSLLDIIAQRAIEGSRSSRAQVSRPLKQEGGEA